MSSSTDCPIDKLPLNKGVSVLAHNEDGLIALEKPAGSMSHPNKPGDQKKSLLVADYNLEEEYFSWMDDSGVKRRVWLLNRLDSPTSGVILVGLNSEIAHAIKIEFAAHRVTKAYYALVRGKPGTPVGSWTDALRKTISPGRGKQLTSSKCSVSAKSQYQLIKSPTGGFPVALIRLKPITGRTHQLRIHCKQHKLPIVGDRTYGSFSFNREVEMLTDVRRMLLHSAETTVKYSLNGKMRLFEAESPLPDEFQFVMNYRPNSKVSRPPSKPKVGRPTKLAKRRFKS